MAVQVSYPGVYIEEFAPGAPIEGVGTSTAAFIGPAAKGAVNVPTKITSWDQFRRMFGDYPLPGFFLWYAVRGFFENGGRVCYVVRASDGRVGEARLPDRAGNDAFIVRTRQLGPPSPDIEGQITGSHRVSGATVFRPQAEIATVNTVNGREITLFGGGGMTPEQKAAQFRPGDVIAKMDGTEAAEVLRITGSTLRLNRDVRGDYNVSDDIRLADLGVGAGVLRVQAGTGSIARGSLITGTMLTIATGGVSQTYIVDNVLPEYLQTDPPITTYRLVLRDGLRNALNRNPSSGAITVDSEEFDVVISQGSVTQSFSYLSVVPEHPRYFIRVVNQSNTVVEVNHVEPIPVAAPPANLPQNIPPGRGPLPFGGDVAENLSALTDGHFLEALDSLRNVDDVNLLAVPDRSNSSVVQQAMITHCQQMGDRFAVLDAAFGRELFGSDSIEEQRAGLDSERGYAALYYPWVVAPPATGGGPILIPCSGHICGVMARSDNTRGVHKAPANEIVNGALGVERVVSDVEQGELNLQGINLIRVFKRGGRPMVWGARTTATNSNWQYVNVRRLFLYIEESIQEGIRWAVFEPNNPALWGKLRRTISEFLTRIWRDGGLFGESPEKAFYVRIDETLNPDGERALGRLYIEIGLRPSYPAEFIIVRIGIWRDGSELTEL